MNHESLSNDQLDQSLRDLRLTETGGQSDRAGQTVQEMHAHRIELEMSNRALRELQSELQNAVRRYADLYDNLPLPYLTVMITGEIVAANRAAVEWLRADTRDLVGQFFGKFLDAYDAGRLAAHLENALRSRISGKLEVTVRPRRHEPVMVQITSCPAPPLRGPEQHVHLALTDISQLKQSQKMLEEINREQEAFNYSISHDLRAPLITISNYAGIVLTDHAERLGDEGRSMVQRIQGAAHRMEATLKNLLQYSMLGREEISFGEVDLDLLVKELLIEHRAIVQERQAEIIVERPLPNVLGCATILNQVFANLLTNALKYTEPARAPQVRIFGERQNSRVILRVVDNGIGIEPKYHERIFQVFERLHGYSHYPGTGVGLAIARRAVQRMSGRIWVESELGKGSCFCVELPAP